MTWGVVMMEHSFVCNVCSYANGPFSEPCKEVFIKHIQKSVMDMLKTIPLEGFHRCYQKWEQRLHRCVSTQGNYFEEDNIDV